MMDTSIPTILKYLNVDNNNYMVNQNVEMPQRAKKRRLDHLSYEEKLQRKKLKNRVAAQTSRDRKKAKMEQMETAIQELFSKNETIQAECQKLREFNERLQAENAALLQRLEQQQPQCSCSSRTASHQSRPVVHAIDSNGPAAGNDRVHSSASGDQSGSERQGIGIATPPDALPSLPDLLDELEADVDVQQLEQLTQSLLCDIAKDLEHAAEEANHQESVNHNKAEKMVGSTSEELESSGCGMLKEKESLVQDLSEYLLLHHNYAAKPKTLQDIKCTTKSSRQKISKRYKTIRPKQTNKLTLTADTPLVIGCDNTAQDHSNVVTIFVNDEGVPINETVINNDVINEEQVTDNSGTLIVPENNLGGTSPMSVSSSDYGYESLDSPNSSPGLDPWDQSVSELFPSLI